MADTTGPTEHNRWDDSPAEPEAKPGILDSRPPAARLTRGYWAAVVVGLVLLLVLLVFILENGQTARVTFFGAHGHLPQGVALLFAAVIGGLFVVLAGAARILQLRSRVQGHVLPRHGGRRTKKATPHRAEHEITEPPAPSPPPD